MYMYMIFSQKKKLKYVIMCNIKYNNQEIIFFFFKNADGTINIHVTLTSICPN